MWPVPQHYLDALAFPHSHSSWADIYFATPKGMEVYRHIGIVSGDVKADAEASIRYTADLQLDFDITSLSDLPTDVLNVYTTRIALFTSIPGIKDPALHAAYEDVVVPLGMYRIESTNRDTLDIVKLSLGGLEGYVIDDKFFSPVNVMDKTKTVAEMIEILIKESLPNAEVVVEPSWDPLDPVNKLITHDEPFDRERWGAITTLADSAECVVYAGPDGKFHIKDSPAKLLRYDPMNAAWEVKQGKYGVLTSINTSVTRDSVYNGVLAHNDSPKDDAPAVWGEALEMDPDSPVYWEGPFGKKAKFISNANWQTPEECEWAAVYELNYAFGANRQIKFGAVPNYALEPYDVVNVETVSGGVEQHLVTSLSYSLTHEKGVSAETKAKSEMAYLIWDELPVPSIHNPTKYYIWAHQTKIWEDARKKEDLTP